MTGSGPEIIHLPNKSAKIMLIASDFVISPSSISCFRTSIMQEGGSPHPGSHSFSSQYLKTMSNNVEHGTQKSGQYRSGIQPRIEGGITMNNSFETDKPIRLELV